MNIFRSIDRDLERPGVPNAMLAIVYWGVTMVVGLWVVGMLTGCDNRPVAATSSNCLRVDVNGFSMTYCRIEIDGKSCLVSPGLHSSGITCDWQNAQRSEAQGAEK